MRHKLASIINQRRMLDYQQPLGPVIIVTAIMTVERKHRRQSKQFSKGARVNGAAPRWAGAPTDVMMTLTQPQQNEDRVAAVLETNKPNQSERGANLAPRFAPLRS